MSETNTARSGTWASPDRAAPPVRVQTNHSSHSFSRSWHCAQPGGKRKDADIFTVTAIATADVERAIDAWGDAVYRLALCRMGNRTDAEDVFQTVFLKLCERRDPFHDDEHLKAWLLRVTLTSSTDALRSPWRRRHAAAQEAEQALTQATIDRDDLPFPDTKAAGIEEACASAVSQLSEKQRIAVHLHYFEGYPVQEIARITGEKPATVRSHLHRARKALRTIMESEEDWEQ